MKYKIGDKVRIHDCTGNPEFNGKIGIVIEVDRIKRIGCEWNYLCKFEDIFSYPFGPPEMEKVSTKGEQLLLFEL